MIGASVKTRKKSPLTAVYDDALAVLAESKRAGSPAEDRRGLKEGRVAHDVAEVGRRDPEAAQVATEILLGDVDDAIRAGDAGAAGAGRRPRA